MKSPDGRRVGWLIWTRSKTRTAGDGVTLVEEGWVAAAAGWRRVGVTLVGWEDGLLGSATGGGDWDGGG